MSAANGGGPDWDPDRPALLTEAKRLTAAGLFVVACERGTKGPQTNGWQNQRLTLDELPLMFQCETTTGLGLLTGVAENPMVDVDKDCSEAVCAGSHFLPRSHARHGRASTPGAHDWYFTDAPCNTVKYQDPVRRARKAADCVLVELRGARCQTLVPPSRHPETGEALRWEGGDLAVAPAERVPIGVLQRAVALTASAALLARYWPGTGARQDTALALSGWLLRCAWSVEATERFLAAVVRVAGDEEAEKRVASVQATRVRLDAGEDVTGRPRLQELLGEVGEPVVKAVAAWLGLSTAHGAVPSANTAGARPAPTDAKAASDPWEEPVPLVVADPPEFPVQVLPSWLRDAVDAISTAKQTPPALAGNLALSVLAAAVQKRVEVVIREGWSEVLALWTVTALPPGNRKSPVYQAMTGPLADYECEEAATLEPLIAASQAEYDVLEASVKRAKDLAAKEDDQAQRDQLMQEVKSLATALQEMKVPVPPRLLVDDVTPEALGILMSENDGRMAVFSDEGGIFALLAGRYSNGIPNLDLLLKGHSGGDAKVDRVGRAPVFIRRAAITFGLTVQPDVIRGLTDVREFAGRGLLARFLYGVPRSLVGEREVRPKACPPAVLEAYQERCRMLLAIRLQTDVNGDPTPHPLRFAPDADDALADFERSLEPRLAPGRDAPLMIEWASKLAGQTARIAALLHLAFQAGPPDPWKIPVGAAIVDDAVELARYFLAHARTAFGLMNTHPAFDRARRVLDWIEKTRPDSFSQRDAHRALEHVIPRAEELAEALAVLTERGYLRQLAGPERSGSGRSPSPRFAVHPAIRGGN